MNELSGRLIDQHQRLTGMVQELREALITKNRLAGLEQELQIAAQVQLSILPRQPPQDARVQLHCHITPAREVGGDFYDYFFIDPRTWASSSPTCRARACRRRCS
jgi:sigma-B regulation protein RsbU (phosphoserine phosphatase)